MLGFGPVASIRQDLVLAPLRIGNAFQGPDPARLFPAVASLPQGLRDARCDRWVGYHLISGSQSREPGQPSRCFCLAKVSLPGSWTPLPPIWNQQYGEGSPPPRRWRVGYPQLPVSSRQFPVLRLQQLASEPAELESCCREIFKEQVEKQKWGLSAWAENPLCFEGRARGTRRQAETMWEGVRKCRGSRRKEC